jgi:hypothetical protein
MIHFIDPNSDEFKKIKQMSLTSTCVICQKALKDNGVYFSYIDEEEKKDKEDNTFAHHYRLGCKYCRTVYSMDFRILALDFESFPIKEVTYA